MALCNTKHTMCFIWGFTETNSILVFVDSIKNNKNEFNIESFRWPREKQNLLDMVIRYSSEYKSNTVKVAYRSKDFITVLAALD